MASTRLSREQAAASIMARLSSTALFTSVRRLSRPCPASILQGRGPGARRERACAGCSECSHGFPARRSRASPCPGARGHGKTKAAGACGAEAHRASMHRAQGRALSTAPARVDGGAISNTEVPRKAPVRAAAVWGDMETLKDDISESEWAHYDADAPTPTPEQDAAVLEPVLEEEERREVVPANPSPPSSAQTLLRARGAARSPRDAARSLGTTPEDTHGITCIVRSRRAGGGFCGSGEAAGAGRGGGTTAGPRQGRGEETETSRQGHPKGRAELDQAQKGRWQVLFLACSKDRSVCTSQRLLILLF